MKITTKIKSIISSLKKKRAEYKKTKVRKKYIEDGMIPWSKGYIPYKKEQIKLNTRDDIILQKFKSSKNISKYGYRLDERIVEYPWIISRIPKSKIKLLDAGSTFNFDYILNNKIFKNKELTIFTFAPEKSSYHMKRISYVYGDLRDTPFKDNYFDFIVSQSTIEHIDMDNSIYGYNDSDSNTNEKSYEYLKAISEMNRVLNSGGDLLLTFPFGVFENHGFFQQFDIEMLDRIKQLLNPYGNINVSFFKYELDGWSNAILEDVIDCKSFNPHTGKGKGGDFAAHSRAIALIEFKKSKL